MLRCSAVVLAAGSSRRLGQPKQLLPYQGTTLLDVTVSSVRALGLPQLIVAVGGAAPEVRETVDLADVTVVDSVHYTVGCSSSIVAALDAIDAEADGFLLFLGDQPHVSTTAVAALLDVATTGVEMAVVRYADGIGHPFYFSRAMFSALEGLHGDKAVWKLLESGDFSTATADVAEPTPLDVDTWDDYERLLANG
ncbi:MAG: nucleotidyltransferase family protein [Actinomycetota bacterium]